MITNITTLKVGDTTVIGSGTQLEQYIGADLAYGFKPSRAGWDKVGAYVNFGIDSLVLTFTEGSEFESLTKDSTVEVVVGNAVETITFTAIVNNVAFISYPENVKVGEKYPQMKQYFRVDLMPTNSTELVEAKAA